MSLLNIKNFEIIHIGKSGGCTVSEELKKINFHPSVKKWHHICKVKYEKNKKYIIIIRNPIKRFVSAFNFQKSRNGDSSDEKYELDKYIT